MIERKLTFKLTSPTGGKRHRFSLFSFGVMAWLAGAVAVLAQAPDEVLAAATKGLPRFLAQIPSQEKALYGFANTPDLGQARLGTPFLLHVIKPGSIPANPEKAAVSGVLTATTQWFCPVTLNGRMKAMLVVDRDQGVWAAVSFGYSRLAEEMDRVGAQWPASQGYHPKLVAVFQARQYYVTIPEVDDANLTAIASASTAGSADRYAKLGSLAGEAGRLRAAFAQAQAQP